MHHTIAHLLRPIATLALAVALAAPVALSAPADAQLGRALPSPVSAAQLEGMLRDAGLPETTKDAALPLHEAYFERFREFEKREIDPTLAKPRESAFDLARSVDDARKEADLRRRAYQRAAQLDGQFVDELAAILPNRDAWKMERVRAALSRRRSAAVAPSFGFSGRTFEYSLRSAPVLATIDEEAMSITNVALETYERELTRQLERYAEATFDRIVRAAELREEMGVKPAPGMQEGDAAGGDAAAGEAAGDRAQSESVDEWFRQMREVQNRANEEVARITARIRLLHREGLEQTMPYLRPHQARALRDHMIGALYPNLRAKSEFDAVFTTALAMRDKGELDKPRWQAVEAIADSNEAATRPIALDLMRSFDERAKDDSGGVMIVIGGDESAMGEVGERIERLRKDLATLDAANAATLRASLGLADPSPQTAREVGREGIVLGGPGGDGVEFSAQAVMVGGDGEMVVLSGEDLADGNMVFSAIGGPGGGRVPRPMNGDELDALATKLGFDKDSRPVFDEVAARCAEARNIAEKELASPAPQFEGLGGEGMSVTIQLAGEDGAVLSGGDNSKLLEAIDALEEKMFDELKAITANERSAAVDAARRARARVRLLPGETGPQAADLVAIAETAALADAARARIAGELTAWDEASVDAIRSMKRELKALETERSEILDKAMTEVVEDDGKGSTSVSRSVSIDGEASERLGALETRIASTRNRVASGNRRALDTMVAALDGDEAAQKALRRGFYRAANPSVYRNARDLEPFFAKALAIEGMSATGKATVGAMRAEWIEARESRCEDFVAAQDAAKAADGNDPAAGMRQMQVRMRERKKLREDLEQLESTIFRKLQEAVVIEVGAEKAKDLGELPTRKRPAMPMIEIGG